MTRRNFGTRLAAAVAGIGAAATATAALAADKQAKHVCKRLEQMQGAGRRAQGRGRKKLVQGQGRLPGAVEGQEVTATSARRH